MGHKQDRIDRLDKRIKDLETENLALRQKHNKEMKRVEQIRATCLAFAAAIVGTESDKLNPDVLLAEFKRLTAEPAAPPMIIPEALPEIPPETDGPNGVLVLAEPPAPQPDLVVEARPNVAILAADIPARLSELTQCVPEPVAQEQPPGVPDPQTQA